MANRIILGDLATPIAEFEPEYVRNITYTSSVDVVGSELSIDVLTPVVDYPYNTDSAQVIGGVDFEWIESSDDYIMCTNKDFIDLRTTPYGTPVYYFRDSSLAAKGYVKNVLRTGDGTYKINAISAIGLLDTQRHNGGMYNATTFAAVLADIIDSAVPYTVDADVGALAIYGEYLPLDTKRANLHKLLFAYGVSIRRDANGDMRFTFLSNEASTSISDDRIYIGGEVDYSALASEVQVTEHSYAQLSGDPTVIEYDNTDGTEAANHTFISFQNAPLYDLQTTGTLVIEESNCNYAIITGTGVLSGKTYMHSTRVLTLLSPDASSQEQNIVSVQDCQTITVLNSANVAARLLAYYASKKTVRSAIVLKGEKAGDFVTAHDPYYESISGFIQSMTVTVSAVNKANSTIVTDFVPVSGNNYTDAKVYTGSGTIDFAALIALYPKKQNDVVQASLIQGGHGGYSGENGETLSTPWYAITDRSGYGGAGGQGGEAGKVLTVSFHVSDLAQTTLAYSCGAGGASDTAGGETTLGNWTSADGAIPLYGIANIFTGETFAVGGVAGQSGGEGQTRQGTRPTVTWRGETWTAGAQGQPYQNSAGTGFGGLGGGAAVSSNGNNGGDGWSNYNGDVFGGTGGAGANGGAGDDADQYGCGGMGGHGGGGGGGNGAARGEPNRWDVGRCGAGGSGGAGGVGGAGLIIVYV